MAYSVFILPRFITSKEAYLQLSQTTTTIHVRLSSKYASVAGFSSYKDIFLGIFFNFQNILLVEHM